MSHRTPLIAGNWKMHKTGAQAVDAATSLCELVASATGVEVMIAPTYTALYQVGQVLAGSGIVLGAQNLHWETHGAYTGEISADMLVDAGVRQHGLVAALPEGPRHDLPVVGIVVYEQHLRRRCHG